MRCVELRQNINECPAFALILLGKLKWLWNISGWLLGIKYSSFRYLWKSRGPWWNHVFFKNGFLEEMRCVELRQNINECPAFALTLLGKLKWLRNISGCLLGIKYSSFRYLWKSRGPWWNHVFFYGFREEITVSVEAPFLTCRDWLFIWYRSVRHGIIFICNRPDGGSGKDRPEACVFSTSKSGIAGQTAFVQS
jgi:hypothetical protein